MSYVGKGQAGNPVLVASEINISGVSSVTLDCFTDDFVWYEIYFYELQSDSTTGDTYLRWNLRAGGSDLTGTYWQAWQYISPTASSVSSANYSSTTTLQMGPPSRLDSDGGSTFNGVAQIDPRTTNIVYFYMDYLHMESGAGNGDHQGNGAIHYDNSGTKIDGFRIYLTTSSSPNEDFDGGAIYVYGYK